MQYEDNLTHPMRGLCDEWMKKIKIAEKVKEDRFGKYAREAQQFYDGAHDFMWKQSYSKAPGGFLSKEASNQNMPMFRMTVNRVFEAVALFGPALYHQYPNVMVTTVTPPDIAPEALGFNMLGMDTSVLQDPQQLQMMDPAMMQQLQQAMQQQQGWAQLQQQQQQKETVKQSCANVKQHVLNWLQVETNKKVESRRSIVECIVKGAGYLKTDIHQPRGSQRKYPKSVHVSCDDVLKDPDAEYNNDVQWIAIKYCHPVNLVERKFGLRRGELNGQRQSYASQVTSKAKSEANKNKAKNGQSFDLIEYYEIFSKNGFGDRLKNTNQQSVKSQYDYSAFGDFTRIVVAEGVPYPLNLPTWSLAEPDDQVFMRSQWPIPFWTDEGCGNGWPIAELGFYESSKSVWPISIIKPAIGELRFVNWCMSFLADKVAAAGTDYIVVAKEAGMEIQEQLSGKMSPYTVFELSKLTGKSINDVVSMLTAPAFSQDIWRMVSEVLELIDKRTGLTELVYGLTGTQIRSAQEASIRENNTNIRPDDMATKTEEFLSESAMKEIEAAVWSCGGEDFIGTIGETGAYFWDTYIRGQEFEEIVRDYKYRIEAGSARKPNKATRLRSLAEFSQQAMPMITNFASQGIVDPWNALMEDYAKAMDLDPSRYLVQLPEQGDQPDPEQLKAEMEMKLKEFELQAKEQESAMKAEEHRMDLEFKQESHAMDMQFKQMELQFKQKEFNFEMKTEKERTKVETEAIKEQTKAKTESQKELNRIKAQNAKQQPKKVTSA